MRIAVDAMGGDLGPRPAVEGALMAIERYRLDVVLVGKTRHIQRLLSAALGRRGPFPRFSADPGRIHIVEAPDVIRMTESPRETLRRKQTSLAVACELTKNGEADALVSAGNTGAVLAHCLFSWRTLPGIQKPAIATFLPTADDVVIVIDAGANVDCKPAQLVNFAIMGSVYAQYVLKREKPRVGLLSNGEEEEKGNEVTKATHKLLRLTDLNFLGNAEGRDVFTGDFDVITCDGFVGNVLLKAAEGCASLVFQAIRKEVNKSAVTMMGALMMKPAARAVKRRTDYDEYGGAPLLGVNGVSIIAHGRSNAKAYMNAIRVAAECVQRGLVGHLKDELTRVNAQIGERPANGAPAAPGQGPSDAG